MINKILRPLDFKKKIQLFSIIFFLLLATLLEILGIGLVPIFLTAILLPEKIPLYFHQFYYVKFILTLSPDIIILYGTFLLLSVFVIKNIFLTILLIYEKNFLKNINVTNATNLFVHFLKSNYSFHLDRNASELFSIITHVNSHYVEYIRCFISNWKCSTYKR